MLRGTRAVLRGRLASDVAALDAGLREDPAGWSRMWGSPWRPSALGQPSPFAERETSVHATAFTIADLETDEPIGGAVLWGIDHEHGSAHVGICLLATSRGMGVGAEVVEMLCEYGFEVLGLQRIGLETLADNAAMRRAAESSGFSLEGLLRETAWVEGGYLDEAVYGLLDAEWRDRRDARSA